MARLRISKEIKAGEGRIALIPKDVARLVAKGHKVVVECGAGELSGFGDADYQEVGAAIDWESGWVKGEVVVKVKELQTQEMRNVADDTTVLMFAHWRGNPGLKEFFDQTAKRGVVAIPYEELVINDSYPILSSMSLCAGEIAAHLTCEYLRTDRQGPGILPSDAVLQILGAGTLGRRAMEVLQNIVKEVHIHDIHFKRVPNHPRVYPHASNPETIKEFLKRADAVICAALRKEGAPKLLDLGSLDLMKPNSFVLDAAIDEGGNFAHAAALNLTPLHPVYALGNKGVRIYAVSNMPGMVPRSSTPRLSQALYPFVETLLNFADKGIRITSAKDLVRAVQGNY